MNNYLAWGDECVITQRKRQTHLVKLSEPENLKGNPDLYATGLELFHQG